MHEKQGVAVRALMKPASKGWRKPAARKAGGEERLDTRDVEQADRKLGAQRGGGEAAENGAKRMGWRNSFASVAGQDQEFGGGAAAGEGRDEIQGGVVTPVDVF